MVRKYIRNWIIRSKIKDLDRDIRAVEFERTIMLARCNYTRAETMKLLVAKLNKERFSLIKELN